MESFPRIHFCIAESALDDEAMFEMRYSVDTPEPTPPSTPPQVVSVQTSVNEEILQARVSVICSLDTAGGIASCRLQSGFIVGADCCHC